MPTDTDIHNQLEQLHGHRENVQLFLRKARIYGGVRLAPPETQHGLAEAYDGIARCKTILRGWNVAVENLLDDAPQPTPNAATHLDPNRASMLEQMRTTWLAGMLDHSLYNLVQLRPRLRTDPQKVDLPVRRLVQEVGGEPKELPEGTRIIEAYDGFGGALLILGEPGAGKTTQLLELARDLLDRAEVDPAHPMPVVFPLSTWATDHKPLEQWLVDQLKALYRVPPKVAADWVGENQVLPLLDGLDEVVEADRPACVKAINAFRSKRGLLPLVVCSRLREFDEVTQTAGSLILRGAVTVQALLPGQVLDALAEVGPAAAALREALQVNRHDWLWEVATTPLWLSVLIPATQHDPRLLQAEGSEAELRERIFSTYVDGMFTRRSEKPSWSREETVRKLGWLAAQMQTRGQTLFLVKGLQPDWLPNQWQQRLVWLSTGMVVGLGYALFVGPVYGLSVGINRGLTIGLIRGSIAGFLVMLFFGLAVSLTSKPKDNRIKPVDRLDWSWPEAWEAIRFILPLGIFTTVSLMLANIIGKNVFGGAFTGLICGIILFVIWTIFALKQKISGVEVDFKNNKRNSIKIILTNGLKLMLVCAAIGGLGGGSNKWMFNQFNIGQNRDLIGWIIGGVHGASFWAVLIGLFVGLKRQDSNLDPYQNYKMSSSVISASKGCFASILSLGLIFALLLGVIAWLPPETGNNFVSNLVVVMIFWLLFCLLLGPLFALYYGVEPFIQHYALRFLLVINHLTPLYYDKFLDHAADRVLLRRVGGGWVFTHRLLLEHFAQKHLDAQAQPQQQLLPKQAD